MITSLDIGPGARNDPLLATAARQIVPEPVSWRLDASKRRYSIMRTLAQPGFWLGLCAARNRQEPHDGRLVASYERAAATLAAEPERDPKTVPEIAAWLERRVGPSTK